MENKAPGVNFVDQASIYIRSGKGGDGCVSFLREKFRPKGGPNGGDGGRGGSVIFVADRNLSTLLDFRYRQHYRAEHGQPGMGKQMHGRKGAHEVVRVPQGTVIQDHETGEFLADLTRDGERFVILRGGKGGRGNMHFTSSTNQAPKTAEPGEPAQERRVRLTMKLIADVGLVGFPNAGKSTLIGRLSAAKPKVADYPFTTLVPNLGMVRSGFEKGYVMADIPGLIRGASAGRGLGLQFLRHVERVKILAFVLSVSFEEERNPEADYRALVEELEAYSPTLATKPRVLVLSKADLPESENHVSRVRSLAEAERAHFFYVSALQGEGLKALQFGLGELVQALHKEEVSEPPPGP